jgi:hypothetical protein
LSIRKKIADNFDFYLGFAIFAQDMCIGVNPFVPYHPVRFQDAIRQTMK